MRGSEGVTVLRWARPGPFRVGAGGGGEGMDFLNCKKDRMGINKRIYLRERVIKGRRNQ